MGADAGIDAGGGDDAGFSAGLDAGSDAGVDAGPPPYDGGPPCSGSPRPHLRCSAPIEVATGSGIELANLAATGDAFLVGWTTGNSVELRAVRLDGGIESLASISPVASPAYSMAGRGQKWALAYSSSSSDTVTCLQQGGDAGVVLTAPGAGGLDELSVATSAQGGVGLAVRKRSSNSYFVAHDLAGCPSSLAQLNQGGLNGISVVHGTASGDDGFRYVLTSQFNAYNGNLDVLRLEPDGGTTRVIVPVSHKAPQVNVSAVSASGQTVLVAFDQVETDDSYTLGFAATSTNMANDGAAQTLFDDPGYWGVTGCGAGCAAVTGIKYSSGGPAVVAFLGDDSQGMLKGKWDAICGLLAQSQNDSSLGIAYVHERLGLLYATSNAVQLYVCDVPP